MSFFASMNRLTLGKTGYELVTRKFLLAYLIGVSSSKILLFLYFRVSNSGI